jgi:hypothetical protein
MTDGSLRLSWDWQHPAVRQYPLLRTKLVVGYILSALAMGMFSYFVGDSADSAVERIAPVVIGFTVAYPFLIALVLGNIQRLAAPETAPTPDEEAP